MEQVWIQSLIGGVIIGVAVSLMLFFNGRVTGISGIFYGLFERKGADKAWRFYFIAGLILGGVFLRQISPQNFGTEVVSPHFYVLFVAGLLVGFGTVLGSGCTSGHGVCGISRWSLRSLVATATFIGIGVLTVFFIKRMGFLL